MVLFATLRRSGGIEAIARHLAIPPAFAQTILPVAIGPVVEQFRRCYEGAGGRAGIDRVMTLLAGFGGGQMAIDVLSPQTVDTAAGKALLTALYGSAENATAAIREVAQVSGIDEVLLFRSFPLLAMLIGGYLAARAEGWASADMSPEDSKARISEFERLISGETALQRPTKFQERD